MIAKLSSILVLIGGAAWFGTKPDWEPAVLVITSLLAWLGLEIADRRKAAEAKLAPPVSTEDPGPQAKIIDELWARREADIKRLFDEIPDKCRNRDELRGHLERRFNEFLAGNVFGAQVPLPWDFTLTAATYDREIVFHPTINPGVRLDTDEALKAATQKRNGESVWPTDKMSEQFSGMFQVHGIPNNRFTKLFFRDFPKFGVVVIYEAHVNVMDRLPRLQKSNGTPVDLRNAHVLDGVWLWQNHLTVTFSGSVARDSENHAATWVWGDQSQRVLIVSWNHGFVDTVQASPAFDSLLGKNQLGQKVQANRKA